ncbi:MAG: glycosyltransferase family 1 protein [Firmicutes bacterium HGW-Firmicutes-2]|jgi:glycosyltransferase involved in cell wall biosynthesis|nr:MAG: glycosyltransferase family 1 protein [Firmicutes bacterium HGW-Firmicutes-2]
MEVKMKIAIFTDTFLPQVNGVTNTLRRFGEYLKANHIDYIFVTPEQKSESDLPYNIEAFLSTPFFLYPECRLTFPNLIRLNKRLDAFGPDIIFTMTEFTMGLCGLNYGKTHNIPAVSNYSTNFSTILKSYKLGVLEKLTDKYLAWFHQEATRTVTPSVESEKILKKLGVLRTGIFGRGIDFDHFSRDKRSVQLRKELGLEGKLGLLYVGRLSPEKDLDVLRDAMQLLNHTYSDQIQLVITGEGPMENELKKTMPDNVVFTGYKRGQALAEIYASCDIFAFPSSFETFGNVVLEAFASGLPVVGVNMGGVKTLIDPGYNGFLVEPNDSEAFALALEKLIVGDIMRHQFGTRGRNYAKGKSWDAVFNTLLEDFATIIRDCEALPEPELNPYYQEENSIA